MAVNGIGNGYFYPVKKSRDSWDEGIGFETIVSDGG